MTTDINTTYNVFLLVFAGFISLFTLVLIIIVVIRSNIGCCHKDLLDPIPNPVENDENVEIVVKKQTRPLLRKNSDTTSSSSESDDDDYSSKKSVSAMSNLILKNTKPQRKKY